MITTIQHRQSHLVGVADLKNALLQNVNTAMTIRVWGQNDERAFGGPVVSWNDEGITIRCRTGELYTLKDQDNCLQFQIEPLQTTTR